MITRTPREQSPENPAFRAPQTRRTKREHPVAVERRRTRPQAALSVQFRNDAAHDEPEQHGPEAGHSPNTMRQLRTPFEPEPLDNVDQQRPVDLKHTGN